MRQLALGLLSLTLAACSYASAEVAEDWQVVEARRQAARERFIEQLPTLKTTRLFRIDPIDGYPGATGNGAKSQMPRFHGWGVVASAAPSDANSEATISQSLAKIVSAHTEGQYACFSPHHGLTLTNGGESYDVLLCFDCSQYIVFTLDSAIVFLDSFNARSEKETWEQVFRAADLPESKRK
jgi:hypothetical protein